MEVVIALIVGLLIGGLGCWVVQEYRNRMRVARLEGQIEQIGDMKEILTIAKEQLNDTLQQSFNPHFNKLVSETAKLSNALTNNRKIGHWGEIQLQRIVELAEMKDYCDFAEQSTANNSIYRPDLLVYLPGKRTIVVDAKTSTEAYMEAQNAEDETRAQEARVKHERALRRQVDELARKEYGLSVENALDFVVMFVPGDHFLSAALSANSDLIEYAMRKRVAIATPASLIALLWAVANGWQRYQVAENVEEIRRTGEEMYTRMLKFIQYYDSVGQGLRSAVRAYNNSIGSFDSRLVPQGRKFAELMSKEEPRLPSGVDNDVRTSEYAQLSTHGPESTD